MSKTVTQVLSQLMESEWSWAGWALTLWVIETRKKKSVPLLTGTAVPLPNSSHPQIFPKAEYENFEVVVKIWIWHVLFGLQSCDVF